MKQFYVNLITTYLDSVVIEAESLEEAQAIAASKHFDVNADYVLDYNHDPDPHIEVTDIAEDF